MVSPHNKCKKPFAPITPSHQMRVISFMQKIPRKFLAVLPNEVDPMQLGSRA